jgi:hypothetical protein
MPSSNPVSTTVASTGLGLKYVGGKTWAAWSGQVVTNNSTLTALEFNSPDVPLKALISWATDFALIGNGHTYKLQIDLNDEIVFRFNTKNESGRASSDWDPIYLVIPPFSIFKLEVYSETANDIKWTINLTADEL